MLLLLENVCIHRTIGWITRWLASVSHPALSHTSTTSITLLHSIYGLDCARYNPSIGLYDCPNALSWFYRLDFNPAVLAALADCQTTLAFTGIGNRGSLRYISLPRRKALDLQSRSSFVRQVKPHTLHFQEFKLRESIRHPQFQRGGPA